MAGDLTLALRTAQSGLLTQQGALNAVSNNIANVNTEGYSRKNVNLETRVLAGNGAGVQLADFTRQIDEGLLKSLRLEKSAFEELDIQDNYYSRLQELFGSPEDNRSLSHLTSEFVAALETLAAAPDETISQSEVARWAGEITMVLQEMSETIQDLRMQADNEIADVSIEINNQIAAIGELNDKIVRNDSVGQDTSDLRDQRDASLDRLSELIDIRYFTRGDGDVVVFTSAGRTLVDNVPGVLTHTGASSVTPTTTHAEGDFSGLYVGDTSLTTNDITNEVRSGQLKGLIDLRDDVLANLQAQLDEFAGELRDVVNQVHNRGAPFPGMQEVTGTRTFIDSANQTITLASGDVTLSLFDSAGAQSATTTLNTIMTAAGFGSGAQASGGPWDIDEVAATIEDWLQANGAASATAAVDASGHLAIDLNAPALNLAFRDETATAAGSTASDVSIQFDSDADGDIDETVSGFSYFFGLNDFFVDGLADNVWESNVISSGFSATAATLTFRDSTGALGNVAISAGDSLTDIASTINNASIGVTASVIPDGNGYRLRISHDTGSSMTVTQDVGGGDTLLTDLGMALADVRSAASLTVRTDIVETPGAMSRGAMQWDANLGVAGEYRFSVADDTIAVALANTMNATNAFDAAGGIAGHTTTFSTFSAEILSLAASNASANETDLDYQRSLTDALQHKSDSTRGVNLDEEMSDLILFEQAYSAAARVISVVQDMFDALDRAVG
ncbi:MAG: flagellar hook-associated protein FlgK [Rhodobacterales bacterium]|nr:flagellar hook-associated protein FlgK [Rhodobacterales bacterium]